MNYKLFSILCLFGLSLIICYFLIHNNILCSSQSFRNDILSKLCSRNLSSKPIFYNDDSTEDLCSILCNREISIYCHSYHLSKPFVLTIEFLEENETQRIVIKSVLEEEGDEDAYWYQQSAFPYIPTTEDLHTMVIRQVSSFLGRQVDGSLRDIQSYLFSLEVHDLQIHKEFWRFIYDHEFLTTYLFQNFRVFPKVIGTCGDFYGVEFAKPFIENPIMPIKMPWNVRITKSIELLKLVEKFKVMWFEELHLCDIKHDHFGWTADGNLLYLDIDCVVTDSFLKNTMISIPYCTSDEDCSFFDCSGQCLDTNRCSGERINTNLQTLCNKIFLGRSDSIIPIVGLLSDLEISDNLHDALHLCSNNPGMTSNVLIDVLQNEVEKYINHYEF